MSWPDLRRREEDLPELMDDPQCDLEGLHRTYAQFDRVNLLLSGWTRIYRRSIRPRLSAARPATLLDIGCGGGDVVRRLICWAARDGFTMRALGIDTDERAVRYAAGRPALSGLQFRTVSSADLCREGASFDFVISNHVLHHLTDTQRSAMLSDSLLLARTWAAHNDIERGALAYAGFAVLSRVLFRDSFVGTDGLRSVRRSLTRSELRRDLPAGWQLSHPVPFRLLLSAAGAAHA